MATVGSEHHHLRGFCTFSSVFKSINKAGYTANTSCGRVGRGGNAGFHNFQLDHHERTDGRTDGRTDKASYRVACPQLKMCTCSYNKNVSHLFNLTSL